MVEPLGPRPLGPYSGVNRVVPTKDRKPKKKKPGEDAKRDESAEEEGEDGIRKGRRIDDRV